MHKKNFYPAPPKNKKNESSKLKGFKPVYSLWFEKDGAFFGDDLFKLLVSIRASGSITQAARELGISYRTAWGNIKNIEKGLEKELVYSQAGGEMGGGTGLTQEAEELLQKYSALKREMDNVIYTFHIDLLDSKDN